MEEEKENEEKPEEKKEVDERWSARWEAVEFEHHPKTRRWYYTASIITVLAALDAYLLNNLILSTLILLSGAVLMFSASKPSSATSYELDWRGLTINGDTHRFNEYASFWLVETKNGNMLLLAPTKTFQQQIIVPLKDVDLYNVQRLLLKYLPEVEDRIPLSHSIIGYLGF